MEHCLWSFCKFWLSGKHTRFVILRLLVKGQSRPPVVFLCETFPSCCLVLAGHRKCTQDSHLAAVNFCENEINLTMYLFTLQLVQVYGTQIPVHWLTEVMKPQSLLQTGKLSNAPKVFPSWSRTC